MPERSGPLQQGFILPNRPRLGGAVSPNRRFRVMFNSNHISAANSRPSNGPSGLTRAGTVAAGCVNDNDRTVPCTAYSTRWSEVSLPETDNQTQSSKPARRMTIGEPLRDESPRYKEASAMKSIVNHGSAGTQGSSLSSPVSGSKTERIYGTTYIHGQTIGLQENDMSGEHVLYGATHPTLRNGQQEMQYKIPGEGKESNADVDTNDDIRSCWSSLIDFVTCSNILKTHRHKEGSAK